MADLVPPHVMAEVTDLLRAPYLNSFGSTETGLPPATRSLIPIGAVPASLSKEQSAFCEIKLVDSADNEVATGMPGELAIRGPTVFSGYWQAEETNARDFRGGWFHMGDVFRRNDDGSLDFVDRAKYMIKTGGENVYPAEIERVLMSDPRITEAAVVRVPDAKWGEVPVAFVSRRDATITETDLLVCAGATSPGTNAPGNSSLSISPSFRARPAARCSATKWRTVWSGRSHEREAARQPLLAPERPKKPAAAMLEHESILQRLRAVHRIVDRPDVGHRQALS